MADLSKLARQAANNPAFVAFRLAAYQRAAQLDDAALAAQLGCSLDDLTHLRLCKVPRPDHFQDDIERIAGYVQVEVVKFAQVLR